MAIKHESPVARIQALRLLDGLKLVDEQLLLTLCDDPNPRIVEQAILTAGTQASVSANLKDRIAKLVRAKDARVRFEALLVATPLPSPPEVHGGRLGS